MNNTPTIDLPEEEKKRLENAIGDALIQRAMIGKRSGWGCAIKWFANWEKNFWAKENEKKSLQS
jgi:hypothetical protein